MVQKSEFTEMYEMLPSWHTGRPPVDSLLSALCAEVVEGRACAAAAGKHRRSRAPLTPGAAAAASGAYQGGLPEFLTTEE